MRKFLLFSVLVLVSISVYSINQPTGNPASNTTVTCGVAYYDNGGSGGNYSNNQSSSLCFFPAVAGQYVTITFTAFDTQNGNDVLYIFDGTGGPLIRTVTGVPGLPFTVTATTATGELCCTFISNGSNNRSGWTANVSCTGTPGTPPAFTNSPQDCMQGGGITVCDDQSFSGNSSGPGTINDLPNFVNGCLGGENQSSWYYFSPATPGTVEFLITPSNSADDYDFALYGPFTQVSCPWNTAAQPLRCSWAASLGTTGLQSGSGDNSEGSGGDRYVNPIVVAADEVYVLVIDNYSTSSDPFTLDWTLSGGATLDCTVLPIELLSFWGEYDNNNHYLFWETASETNNDYFTIERSGDNNQFESLSQIQGAGNSNALLSYQFVDSNPLNGNNYYRIKQTDFDGHFSYSPVLRMYHEYQWEIGELYPNPSNEIVSFNVANEVEDVFVLEVRDISGRILKSSSFSVSKQQKNIQFDISEYDNGILMVSFFNGNGNHLSTRKIIKQ